MKKSCLFIIASIFASGILAAQAKSDSMYLLQFNERIDKMVVERNTQFLDSAYASDFVFSHGSGSVDGKTSWLKSVSRNTYLQRQHDSVTVELHPGLAILRGKLSIHRKDGEQLVPYRLRYVRVFAIRDERWQMISHITTHEIHENR